MVEIKKILCPVDFSEHSRAALEFAQGLAAKLDADLELVHVFNSAPAYVGWPGGPSLAAATAQYVEQARTAVSDRLDKLAEEVSASGRAVSSRLLEGVPHVEVVGRSVDSDLVVMATRGTHGPSHLLMGSVAERVVRLAACPVLTIAPEAEATRAEIERIMVAVDFSNSSDTAVAYALDLARTVGAAVTLLHVVPLLAYAAAHRNLADAPGFEQEILNQVSAQLEQTAAQARGSGVTVESLIVQGHPGSDIGATAEQRGMQLVILGSHGRTGLKRALLGSVAERVVRLAHVPVLTVREPG